MTKKIDFKAVLTAVAAGGGYNFAIEGASKRVDFINENFLVVKSLGAGVLGSGMLYFGKNETSKAAGYALLGVAGASGASKLSTVIVSSGEPMNGARLDKIKSILASGKRKGSTFETMANKLIERQAGREGRIAAREARIAGRADRKMMRNEMPMQRPNQTVCATPYGQIAMNDLMF
jgi:hypothetical protein